MIWDSGIYIVLFTLIIIISQVFSKSTIPVSLLLVITGMLLSLIPGFAMVHLHAEVVLNIFLPILIYQISSSIVWRDIRKYFRTIALLSVGHVIFITILVAIIFHALHPSFGWPLAFILGAVIAPPDDVVIVAVAEKIKLPHKIITILESEGMLNDATALILFRFSLVALVTHQFSVVNASLSFVVVVIGEIIYGLVLGHVLGSLRYKIKNSILNMLVSLITPFLAYLLPVFLGGCGVLATAVTGFVIGHSYFSKYSAEFRIMSRAIWPTLAFTIQNLIFMMVGINMHRIVSNIATLPLNIIILNIICILLTVIVGRFIWVFFFVTFLPRFLFPFIKKMDPYPPWQYPFVISWAGMRGGISLAAAYAIPALPLLPTGLSPRDLIIFYVFCVVILTLILQGSLLPWLLKAIGVNKFIAKEKHNEHQSELAAKLKITQQSLAWLINYKGSLENEKLIMVVDAQINNYNLLESQLIHRIDKNEKKMLPSVKEEIKILEQLVRVQRDTLDKLWEDDQITSKTRDKLLKELDHLEKVLI